MAIFDYDESAFKPTIISAHGLRREVRQSSSPGGLTQDARRNKRMHNRAVLQQITSGIYNYGTGANASNADIELRTDKFTNLNIRICL